MENANKPAAHMTLREHYAAKFMAALLIIDGEPCDEAWAAKEAVKSADALLIELEVAKVADEYKEAKP